jgi:hypothetical protein
VTAPGWRGHFPALAHDVRAAVDVDCSARHPPSERRREIGAGPADIHDVDEFAQRRLVGGVVEQQFEGLDARGGACLQRSGRDGVDANAARPQL